jgi:hypothetical protein
MNAKTVIVAAGTLVWIASIAGGYYGGRSQTAQEAPDHPPDLTLSDPQTGKSAAPRAARGPGGLGAVGSTREALLRQIIRRAAEDLGVQELDQVASVRGIARLEVISDEDAAAALDVALELRGNVPGALIFTLLEKYGRHDGPAAVKKSLTLPAKYGGAQASAYHGWAQRDRAAALAGLEGQGGLALTKIFHAWIEKDAKRAVARISELMSDAERGQAIMGCLDGRPVPALRGDLRTLAGALPPEGKPRVLSAMASWWRDEPEAFAVWQEEHGYWRNAGRNPPWSFAGSGWTRTPALRQRGWPASLPVTPPPRGSPRNRPARSWTPPSTP